LEEAESKAEESRERTWCEDNLGRPCLLEDYPDYSDRCLALRGKPCEFGDMLETIGKLPLEVRLEVLRKLSEIQKERFESEFGS
jgi:hypothetical protein